VAGDARIPQAPDVPTAIEGGFERLSGDYWAGIVAPAGTPQPIIDKLNADILAIIHLDAVRARLTTHGFDVAGSSPAQFGEVIRSDMTKYAEVIRKAGIHAN
jgi:tripartite-type tricarboxylate transporter receptor subunit TctC